MKREERDMLNELIESESAAYAALMSDPKVVADKSAEHTPEILSAWHKACAAEREYREANGL